MSEVAPGEVLPDFTVVYANGSKRFDRRGVSEMRKLGMLKQINTLKKMIPNNPDKFKQNI